MDIYKYIYIYIYAAVCVYTSIYNQTLGAEALVTPRASLPGPGALKELRKDAQSSKLKNWKMEICKHGNWRIQN